MKLRFHTGYFFFTLALLLVEVLIAMYVHDAIIRPYIGDFLVVILLYSFVCTFISARVLPVALGVLLFSFFIETAQYFHVVSLLGLQHSTVATVVLGNSFSWTDLLMYTAGMVSVVTAESLRNRRSSSPER